MARLEITFVKRAEKTGVEIRRPDGAVLRFDFPRKGPIPHDYVHLVVEDALGMTRGFWGLVASGVDPAAVADLAKAAGHASAKRAGSPDAAIVELLQAERLVECFEADLWSGPTDGETFRGVAAAACAASHTPDRPLDDATITAIRLRINEFGDRWRAAPEGARFDTVWGG